MSLLQTAVSPEEARAEVGRVLLAQDDLAFFAMYMSMDENNVPWYRAHEVHHLMAMELEKVVRYLETDGKEGTQFLIILVQPQIGKSSLVSRFFPAYVLGKMPNMPIIEVSYGADLAVSHSRAVRNMIMTDRYKSVFGELSPGAEPMQLASDSKSASEWNLAAPHRGGMIATGVGGAVPGRAKGLVIWDDPIKGHREAQSRDILEDAWDFWVSALRVRARAGVLVMTHWSPDDPAGRFIRNNIEKPNGDQWKVLMLPAIVEEGMFAVNKAEQRKKMLEGVYLPLRDPLGRKVGEVLCAPMLSKDELMRIRETQQDFYFQALYQQMPFNKDGQKYKRDWFKVVSKLPEGVTIKYVVRYWDKANSTRGDYTVGCLMAYCSDGFFYILDVVRGQWSSYERDRKMQDTAKKDAETYAKVQIWHQQDPGSAGKDSAEATNRTLMGYPVKFEPVTGDKATRSEPLESAFQGKMVFLLQGAWNAAFVDECVAFDRGKHDDQVDAASSAYNKLLQMIGNFRKSRIG